MGHGMAWSSLLADNRRKGVARTGIRVGELIAFHSRDPSCPSSRALSRLIARERLGTVDMNAHHKKATYRPLPPRIPQHFSSATLQLPLDRSRDARSQSQLWKAVQRVPFGWQMDVVLPEPQTQSSPSLVDHLIQDIERTARHELVRDVNLADLLEPTFLNSFVRKGSLVAISLEAAEGEDVVAIDGRGRLILSVSKSTYELLGLPGRASMHGSFRQRFSSFSFLSFLSRQSTLVLPAAHFEPCPFGSSHRDLVDRSRFSIRETRVRTREASVEALADPDGTVRPTRVRDPERKRQDFRPRHGFRR